MTITYNSSTKQGDTVPAEAKPPRKFTVGKASPAAVRVAVNRLRAKRKPHANGK